MQPFYPERFERDMSCTEAEWLRWLPAAIGEHVWQSDAASAQLELPPGGLQIAWQVGEPLRIAMVSMPRLRVSFVFIGLDAAQRLAFMQRFDLYMQRGGG
jgi:hypothetical protein